jgi:hypothetical protein
MTEKKNALEVAAEVMDDDQQHREEIQRMIGRHEAFGLMAGKTTAAWAESLKRLKDAKAYRKFSLTWEEFCPRMLNISRPTADRIIADREEFGNHYFALSEVARLSRDSYRLIAGQVTDDGQLDIGGELVPITKQNGDRIKDYLGEVLVALRKEKEEHSRTRGNLTKSKEQADNAKKAVERKDEELQALKKKDSEFFKHVEDADHITIIQAHSQFEMVLRKLENLEAADLSPMNVGRLLGMIQYQRCALEQTYARLAEAKGLGDISEFPVDPEFIESCYVGQRNVIAEYLTERKVKEAQ